MFDCLFVLGWTKRYTDHISREE